MKQVIVFLMILLTSIVQAEEHNNSLDDLASNFSLLSLENAGPDDDSFLKLFQDPFCMGDQTRPDSHDRRYEVHSFAILFGRLYIFTATSIFNVSLDEEPPFSVSSRTLFTDFNNQLSNMLYSTPFITSMVFTSVGIEIDEEKAFLALGIAMIVVQFKDEYDKYEMQTISFGERMRDVYVLHNRALAFQPAPFNFSYSFSARFSEKPNEDRSTKEVWSGNRFIVGSGFFYFVEVNTDDNFNITHYAVLPGVNFNITPMVVYEADPNTSNQWIFLPVTASAPAGYRKVENASKDLIFAKNGYINGQKMYLLDWATNNTLVFSFVTKDEAAAGAGQVEITFNSNIATWALIDCHLSNDDKVFIHVLEPVLLIVLLILTTLIGLRKRATVGHRVINGPGLSYYEIDDALIYSKYGGK